MGHVYARDILGLDSPRVGLLSVGEEEGKGNELTKETYEQLRESSLNFVGNVEGRDIYNGRCDVVVTDGFTGNVALKISESLAEMIGAMIKEELMRDARSKIGAKLAMPAFERFRRRIDYTEMGGAPLLGIGRRRHHLSRCIAGEGDQERGARGPGMGERRAQRAHQIRAGSRGGAPRRGT